MIIANSLDELIRLSRLHNARIVCRDIFRSFEISERANQIITEKESPFDSAIRGPITYEEFIRDDSETVVIEDISDFLSFALGEGIVGYTIGDTICQSVS